MAGNEFPFLEDKTWRKKYFSETFTFYNLILYLSKISKYILFCKCPIYVCPTAGEKGKLGGGPGAHTR